MLTSGFIIMFIGMGIVVSFLIILILAMNLTAVCVRELNKYFPEEVEVPAGPVTVQSNMDEEIAVVIAAVQSHIKG